MRFRDGAASKVAQPELRFVGNVTKTLSRQPRLADARLARENEDLAAAGLGGLPKVDEPAGLAFAPDKGAELRAAQRLEATLDRASRENRPSPGRRLDALEIMDAEIPEIVKLAKKAAGVV